MGRLTGPTERLSRREGVELELKGLRRLSGSPASSGVAHSRPASTGTRDRVAAAAAGDVVSIRDGSAVRPVVEEATTLLARVPGWLLADHDALTGKVLRMPERAEIDVPVDEQLVVELLSRS